MKTFKNSGMAIIIAILFSGLAGCSSSYPVATETQYTNPAWAPPYYAGVRYYYLPDIESYYDLSNQDFAYLDNGQWIFSASLPPMYSNYDLYSGFSVSLNTGIYQPWLHHQNYVRNYPRYYYRNKYQGTQYTGVRGFNENSRQPVLRRTEDRNNYQPRPGEINVQNNNNPPRSGQINNQNNNNHKPENTRPPQNPAYHGKNIGEPVKVRPNMRQPKADKRIDNKKNGNAAANNHGHGK